MSLNLKKFSPHPGLVNKQGCLPDPSELVCIEVPKIFDQCLIKRCLIYDEGTDTDKTDCELRSDPIINPKRYIGSRDFNLTLISVDKIPLKGKPGFKKIVISYKISFYADYIDAKGKNQCEFFEINRTDVITKFYCPDSIAQISASFVPVHDAQDLDSNIIKLEMVAEALDGEFRKAQKKDKEYLDGELGKDEKKDKEYLDITLGYYIVVKAELIVQLLIPAYGYCPVPKEPCEESEENLCEKFCKAPIPKFYPDQNLKPLFPDHHDHDDDCCDGE